MHYLINDEVTSLIIVFKEGDFDAYRFGFRRECSERSANRLPADHRLRHHRQTQRAALPLHGSCP